MYTIARAMCHSMTVSQSGGGAMGRGVGGGAMGRGDDEGGGEVAAAAPLPVLLPPLPPPPWACKMIGTKMKPCCWRRSGLGTVQGRARDGM